MVIKEDSIYIKWSKEKVIGGLIIFNFLNILFTNIHMYLNFITETAQSINPVTMSKDHNFIIHF